MTEDAAQIPPPMNPASTPDDGQPQSYGQLPSRIRIGRTPLYVGLAVVGFVAVIILGPVFVAELSGNHGSFSLTGSMATARVTQTATALLDGRVLVVGGATGCATGVSCRSVASAEVYDPKTGKFSPTGSMAAARTWASATRLLDGRVLIAGGSDGSAYLTSAEI